jgi:hypothetical protein
MLVVTLDRESGINPVLLTPSIVTYIRVAQRRQFTGGVFRGVSGRAGTVNDDLCVPIRKELRSKRRHIFRRQVYSSGYVAVVVGRGRQSFDEPKVVFPIKLLLQFSP